MQVPLHDRPFYPQACLCCGMVLMRSRTKVITARCDRADGRPSKAVVADFKTDNVESLETLRSRFADRVAVYRKAVRAALRLPDDRIEVVLLSTFLKRLLSL